MESRAVGGYVLPLVTSQGWPEYISQETDKPQKNLFQEFLCLSHVFWDLTHFGWLIWIVALIRGIIRGLFRMLAKCTLKYTEC